MNEQSESIDPEKIRAEHENSILRKLIESPFLLLIISLIIVFLSYTTWGVIELFKLPKGNLP